MARHYGMPTRLLDWTENAAAALFFAVEYPNGGVDSAVWCSERPSEADITKSPFEVDHIYLYNPPHIAPRHASEAEYGPSSRITTNLLHTPRLCKGGRWADYLRNWTG